MLDSTHIALAALGFIAGATTHRFRHKFAKQRQQSRAELAAQRRELADRLYQDCAAIRRRLYPGDDQT
jgi:hypothetical protein